MALENAGAHDADRGAFAPLKIFGRLGDPARDDLVALKQDSTKILAVLNEARRRGGRGPRRRAQVVGPGRRPGDVPVPNDNGADAVVTRTRRISARSVAESRVYGKL